MHALEGVQDRVVPQIYIFHTYTGPKLTQTQMYTPGIPVLWSNHWSNFTLFSRFFSLSLLSRNEIEMTGNQDREMKVK